MLKMFRTVTTPDILTTPEIHVVTTPDITKTRYPPYYVWSMSYLHTAWWMFGRVKVWISFFTHGVVDVLDVVNCSVSTTPLTHPN